MKIKLSPVRTDSMNPLVLFLNGTTLTVNGDEFDLSVIPEGATLPASAIDSPYFSDEIVNNDGEIELTLILPHGPNAPEYMRFPKDIIAINDGEIVVPLMPEPVSEVSYED